MTDARRGSGSKSKPIYCEVKSTNSFGVYLNLYSQHILFNWPERFTLQFRTTPPAPRAAFPSRGKGSDATRRVLRRRKLREVCFMSSWTDDDKDADHHHQEYIYEDPPSPPSSIFCSCQPKPKPKKMSTSNWMERMKKAGKSVVDAGAKTMLRVCM